MNEIRWGIIGCGDVTEVKSGPALRLIDHSDLLAVMRRNGDKARDYARRHKVKQWYTDASELINNPEVNTIYIATPPDSHEKYALMAAEAGKPAYIEKPMARTHAECVRIIEAFEKRNLPLYVAYYRRGLPLFLKVKELLDQAAIGEVRTVHIHLHHPTDPDEYPTGALPWRVVPEIAGGGLFHDLASHQLDIMDFFFGPISQATGITANQAGLYTPPDAITAAFRFESGITGSGNWSFAVGDKARKDQVEISGSKGKITFSVFDNNPLVLSTEGGHQAFSFINPQHIQQPLIQTVVDDLRGIGKCPSTGESGARTSWVIDCITS